MVFTKKTKKQTKKNKPFEIYTAPHLSVITNVQRSKL